MLVVGGGPSGAACAFWLAEAGHDVLLLEKKRYPREKTCGDGLTPRAVKELEDMGLAEALARHHRFGGLRSIAFGRTLELEWPETPGFPRYGYVVTRHDLDQLVAERAVKAGATLWEGSEAVAPLLDDGGRVAGAVVKRKPHPDVADGANSRFGRALGTSRNRSWPQGMAIRGYFTSPRHDEPWIESHLDVHDPDGNVLPGYGWIFPVGDGRVNVGVGLLSTFRHWKSVNTTKLMDAFVGWAPESWGIAPETSCGPPVGGRLPMGMAVGPSSGPNWLATGDAAGTINPFNGEGIAYAYETGRFAAEALGAALATGDPAALRTYDERLQAEYALYFKVARAFVRVIGRPALMRALVGTGMHSRTLMEWVLRIMANLLRPDELGPAEAAYKAVAAIARLAPERDRAAAAS
ncbi:MAG TPA: geranylgeranyl reductase family protein [Acidimicrobiales bacterium]|nr:geranylgeranyl reductase family protein [Acidimicrobiales bacterium]